MDEQQIIFNPFLEPIDHILERAGFCSNRAFKAFIKNRKVEIIRSPAHPAKANCQKPQVHQQCQPFEASTTCQTCPMPQPSQTPQPLNSCPIHVTSRATLFDGDGDLLQIDGVQIKLSPHLYILLNKPVGVVCSRTSDSHPTIFSILPPQLHNHSLFAHLHIAGRLDEQSRGLVFLTTNGALSNYFISPQSHLPKKYSVTLQKPCTPALQADYARQFLAGINLAAQKKAPAFCTKPAQLAFTAPNQCTVTLTEGKFHQVRRMFAALDNTVIDLQRTHIGSFCLPADLPQGECVLMPRSQTEQILKISLNARSVEELIQKP